MQHHQEVEILSKLQELGEGRVVHWWIPKTKQKNYFLLCVFYSHTKVTVIRLSCYFMYYFPSSICYNYFIPVANASYKYRLLKSSCHSFSVLGTVSAECTSLKSTFSSIAPLSNVSLSSTFMTYVHSTKGLFSTVLILEHKRRNNRSTFEIIKLKRFEKTY